MNGGLIPGRDKRFFLLHSIEAGTGVHPASYPVETGGFIHWDEVARREANHLNLVPMLRLRTSVSPYVFMVWGSIKFRDKFTFSFTLRVKG
jgi:hypothetical protein